MSYVYIRFLKHSRNKKSMHFKVLLNQIIKHYSLHKNGNSLPIRLKYSNIEIIHKHNLIQQNRYGHTDRIQNTMYSKITKYNI